MSTPASLLRIVFLPGLLVAVAGAYACGTGDNPVDGGTVPTPNADAGAAAETSTTLPDGGTLPPLTDSSVPGTDASPEKDSGTTHADSGAHPGSNADGGNVPPDAGTIGPTGPATGLIVQVTNSCPVDVWIHGVAKEGTLAPDNVHLGPGLTVQYNAPLTWSAGRVYAYLQAPDGSGNPQGQNDKIEMNFGVSNGSESINTDVTYVDWLALPSRIEGIGSGSDCTTVSCDLPYAHVLDGCPSSLLSGHECLSAGSYCLDTTHDGDPFCHALDNQVSTCASMYSDCAAAAGSTTAQVYSCSGSFFSQNPEYCAALNRGVLSQPGVSTPASSFYTSPPFNEYSAWVHRTCPGIYAFPYDDYGSSNQSSDHTCTGATQLNITFCPGG
jgi:hypothetical protein